MGGFLCALSLTALFPPASSWVLCHGCPVGANGCPSSGWWRQPDEGLVSPISRAEMSRVSISRKSVEFDSSLSAVRLKRRAALSFYCSMAKVTVTLTL